MFEKFAEDVMTRYQEKLAELADMMEKDATPSLGKYLEAVAKRNFGIGSVREALREPTVGNMAKALTDPLTNLGAAGNKRLNQLSGGVLGAMKKGIVPNNEVGGILLNGKIKSLPIVKGVIEKSKPNPKYLSRITGITDEKALNTILENPYWYA